MSLSSDGNQGYLDIRNAILRVGTLDVYGITGVDQVTNVVKQNSVLIWDDQGSDMTTPPFQKGAGVARSTSPPEINLVDSEGNNFMYQGLKLPNSWQGEFDLYFADATAGAINCHFYTTSTTSYADDGYELAFDRENSTITLRYDAAQVAQATGVTLSTQWHTASVTFNRGAWAVSLDGERLLTHDDDERSAVYDNTTGQYVRFETAATTDRKVRYIKFLNNGAPWLESNAGHLYNLSSNVAIGVSEDDYRFSVAGTANLGATTVTSIAVGDDTDSTSTSTGALTVQGLGVASNLHATNVYATNVFVGTHAGVDAYDFSVHGTANTGVLTATSIVVGDETEATSVSTGALQTFALGVESNIHTNNLYSDHANTQTLEVNETVTVNANVYAKGLHLAEVASNLVTWDSTTGDLMDSGGLISNKLAIVSEQPPAALTGASTVVEGHGRYKVTASSEGGINTHPSWQTFNKTNATTGGSYSSSESYTTTSPYAHTGGMSLGGVTGEWVKLELPYKTKLRHISLQVRADNVGKNMPGAFSIIGSNDNTSWTTLGSFSGLTLDDYTDGVQKQFVVNATEHYKYYAIVVTNIAGDAAAGRLILGEWRLFTETFTVDAGVVSTTAASGLDVGYTEHPVEPMTDYHTYVEGHGTYEVSASTYDSDNSLYPWYAFDYVTTPPKRWSTPLAQYNTSGIYTANVTSTDIGGTRHLGEWLQIKLPYDITLSKIKLLTNPGLIFRAVTGGTILGSNDGTNWYEITTFSDLSHTEGEYATVDINATTPYMYYRLVVKNVPTGIANNRPDILEWRLFAEKSVTRMENVHISGDLSSETLQTGYIKWPKVPLKANESGGYVVDASSADSGFTMIWSAFNDVFIGQSTEYWDSATTYSTSTGAHDNTVSTTDSDGVTRYGEWIQIKLTNAISLHSMKWYPRIFYSSGSTYETWPLERVPKSGVIMGSNDGITWHTLRDFADISYTTAAYVEGTEVKVISSTPYVYYRLVITSLNAGTGSNRAGIMELQLFEAATGVGAAPTSAKLQVAGSLGMAKGSEFFAGDDVVMELPKHDRPLVKYPEIPITSSSTIDGYTATASSYVYREPWQAFDSNNTTSWTSNYGYTGSPLTGGEYLQLELPVAIKVVKMYIKAVASTNYQHAPQDAELLGSNDGTTWVSLNTSTDLPLESYAASTWVHINATQYYKYLRLKITKIYSGSTTYARVADLQFWGHEEGDTSVDVVHRSIPNKPGQQHLEVYWDANDSNSYSFADSSNVYDLSGSGVTGTLTGTNGFDAEYNAWVFDGSGDYISGTQGLGTGQPVHSQSVWFKRNGVTGTYQYINIIGTSGGGTQAGFVIMNNGVTLQTSSYGNDIRTIDTVEGQWYHAVLVHTGGDWTSSNTLTYVNGELATVTSVSKNSTFNLTGTTVTLGTNTNGTEGLNGSIANFRLFGKALNADQVLELYEYDAPRFGHRQNLVSLHKGNLGIGLRDPEQRLVVAGSLQEFPPGPMTSSQTHFTGHGIFKAISSGGEQGGSEPLDAFIKDWSSSSFWYSRGNTYGTTSTNVTGGRNAYTGSYSLDGYSGEWLGLMFPCGFVCKSMEIAARNGEIISAPHDIVVLGATNPFDETEWETIGTFYGKSSNDFWVDGGVGINFPINYDKPVYGIALVFTTGNYYYAVTLGEIQFFGIPQMNVTDGRQLNVGQVMTSSVGIGTTAPHASLTVFSAPYNGVNSFSSGGSKRYFRYNTDTTGSTQPGGNTGGLGIYSLYTIATQSYLMSHSGTLQSSDRRIKNNIVDIDDSSALDTFRLLQPKLYNYKDVVQRGSSPVWGFIAQEVADTLTYSTQKRTEWVPNVYELANVHAEGAVLEFDTTKLETGASVRLRLYDLNDKEEDVDVDEIIDEYTVRLTKPIESRHKVFVYGQEVRDFHFLKKDAIWTTAAAALQEVDRRQQKDAADIKLLKEKDSRVKRPLAFTGGQGLLVDATGVLSNVAQSKDVLGVVAETPGVVETSGEHYLWVCNEQGSLDVGDLLTTSNVAGYATKQDDDLVHNYTVAKVLEPCDFTQPQVPSKRLVSNTVNVNYYVHTSNVSLDVYSNLAVDARTTLTETYYEKITRVQVKYNEYIGKMPAYDIELYYKLNWISVSREVYESLPDHEAANYVVESTVDGEPHTYVYRYDIYLTLDEWRDLDEFDQTGYTHGYFKDVVEERTEPADGFTQKSRIIYQKILNTISEPCNGYTLLVRQEQVPVLDAFGNLQYVEDPTEVVDSYDMRYVDADGDLTTRHNEVYRAAHLRCILV
jgi:hypothetical protein